MPASGNHKICLLSFFVTVAVWLLMTVLIPGQSADSNVYAQSAATVLRVDSQYNAAAGEFVEVPVYVENSPGMAAYYFDLYYDADIAVVRPETAGDAAVKVGADLHGSNPIVNLNYADDGVIRVAWMDLDPFTGSGEVCRISFEVLSAGSTVLRLENAELVGMTGSISVTAANGLLSVDPPPPIDGVTIPGGDRTLERGRSVWLSVEIEPQNAPYNEISWHSSDTAVATVSSDGRVTARSTGTADITVTVSTDARDYEDTITVTVSPDPVPPEFTIDTPRELPHGYRDRYYTHDLSASDGRTPYRWSRISGSLPPGLALSSAGKLSGTPREPGRYDFTLRVRDNAGEQLSRDFVLWIAERDYFGYEPGVLYPADWGVFKNLTINHGSMNVNLQPHELPHTMVVGRTTSQVEVAVGLIRSGDRLRINGTLQSSDSARRVSLRPGTNNISITVQPSSGSSRNFNVTIYKIP